MGVTGDPAQGELLDRKIKRSKGLGRKSFLPDLLILLFLPLPLLVTGCEVRFPHASRGTVSLRMHGTPPDATVTIDEEMVGPLDVVAVRGVALPAGTHQVTVEAPGYFPWDKLVKADPGAAKRIDLPVELVPVPR
jgi:hypothetical protein